MGSNKWEIWLNNLKGSAGSLVKGEIKNLLNTAKKDSEAFIKRQGVKLESYLNQLADGLITKDEFEGYVVDIKYLTESQALKMSVSGKASAQRLAKGIQNIVIKRLLDLLK